jgi:cell division protein FtsN
MPRDYKNRSHHKKFKRVQKIKLKGLEGLFILSFIVISLLSIAFFINPSLPKAIFNIDSLLFTTTINDQQTAALVVKKQLQNKNIQQLAAKAQAKIKQNTEQSATKIALTQEPRFDFYTILPELEVVIPDHEIKTRIREEKIGTLKKGGQYIMQAGSFREFLEAQKFQHRLTALGVESRIERARVGHVIWNRIKMGPFFGLSAVMAIKIRLRDHGIDTLVLEFTR